MGTFIIVGFLFIMSCDFAFVRLVSLESDINLKLKRSWTDLHMGLTGNTHNYVDILVWKVLTASIIKSGVRMGHPSERVIIAKGVTFLEFIYMGHLHSKIHFLITAL